MTLRIQWNVSVPPGCDTSLILCSGLIAEGSRSQFRFRHRVVRPLLVIFLDSDPCYSVSFCLFPVAPSQIYILHHFMLSCPICW